MIDKNDFSQAVKEKFEQLPVFVQETIMQTSAKIETPEQLEAIAKEIVAADKNR